MAIRCVGIGHRRAPAEGARGLQTFVGRNRQVFEVNRGTTYHQPQVRVGRIILH
jgi:hypothetical protein